MTAVAACDAVVIGGGFFGCSIAGYLRTRGRSVLLLEREPGLFRHASYANQARIHNGYHYPRSLHTAYRSRVNFQTFLRDFPECVVRNFTKLYAIARNHSKVSARQFERFCDTIGAPWAPASKSFTRLFNPQLIESVYEVTEHAFDSGILREIVASRLARSGVEVRCNTPVVRLETDGQESRITLGDGSQLNARTVFNCTYAGLKRLAPHCSAQLKQEVAELALIEPPGELRDIGVTVMCGPFFSTMPFPPRGLHTLSHVRYTPHCHWTDGDAGTPANPYEPLADMPKRSQALHMLRDAERYLPLLRRARIVESLFSIKTVLARNEMDDGRPILVDRSPTPNPVYSIMGGKLDNVYDVLHRLASEPL
ncbi:MAG TPA: FAD-dependent oxidoreductase [Bryobacteraceae bacterium]|nr:FAD-dependent oxidoreductase [Bryobacteraceae bacterium]